MKDLNIDKVNISVVIPVYKVKTSLLQKCLQSMIKQKYEFVEYLIIDDGSPDQCGEICDEYALKDSRLKVFHRNNEGVSGARNFGLSIAKGKYVMFVDGDDYIEENAIEILMTYLEKKKYDITFFKYNRLKEGEEPKLLDTNLNNIDLNVENIACAIVSNDEKSLGIKNVCFGSPWGKVFCCDYLKRNNIEFPLGIKKSQDRIFMLRTMAFSPRINLINYYGYFYIENDGSICQAYNSDIVKILEKASKEFDNTIKEYYTGKIREKLSINYNYLQFDFLFNMFRLYYFNRSHITVKKDFEEYLELCQKKRKYYTKCSHKGMGKKKKIILFLLKAKMYKLLYFIMSKIIKMN